MPDVAVRRAWTRVAFGDVVRLSKERSSNPEEDGFERFVGLDHLDPGDLRIRRWGNIADGSTFTSVFRPGQVLFGKRRAYQRKVAVADFSGVCSGDIYVLEPTNAHLLPELLPFICQTDGFFDHAIGTSAGSLSPRTNWVSLARYEFALPPLSEQRRIADLLMAIEATRNAYSRTSDTLAVATEALVADTVHGLWKSFSAVKLRDLAVVAYGLTVNPERRKSKTRVPYLRVANVMRGGFDLSEIKEVGASEGDDAHRLVDGDVLVVEGHADAAQIGRAAVWEGQLPNMLHQNHLIRARCGEGLAPQFLCLLINSPHGQAYFRSHAKSSSGLNTINSTVVKDYVIAAPPLEVQVALIERASTSARLEGDMSHRRSSLAQLRRQVLQSLEGTGH